MMNLLQTGRTEGAARVATFSEKREEFAGWWEVCTRGGARTGNLVSVSVQARREYRNACFHGSGNVLC